jgi:hypothetical protein
MERTIVHRETLYKGISPTPADNFVLASAPGVEYTTATRGENSGRQIISSQSKRRPDSPAAPDPRANDPERKRPFVEVDVVEFDSSLQIMASSPVAWRQIQRLLSVQPTPAIRHLIRTSHDHQIRSHISTGPRRRHDDDGSIAG